VNIQMLAQAGPYEEENHGSTAQWLSRKKPLVGLRKNGEVLGRTKLKVKIRHKISAVVIGEK
jgi:hypothetical protein